ncbi:MAG: ABC transporter permease, partial [Oscillibacter sp.]|nr:ABC transporter permease [Oscillibacter sp.]
MGFLETFTLALKNIWGSKLRTFLTMLGIIIGVCAVIVIVGLGNGMANYMEESFASMGTNSLTVMVMGRGSSRSVSEEQMYEIVAENPALLDQISPTVSMSGSVKIGTETTSSSVTGVSEDYFSMKGYEVSEGRGIQFLDIEDRKNICIVGNYVSKTYFDGNAVGETLKIGGNQYRIVGVMAQEAEEMEEGGTDDCVYVPYSTAARQSFTGTISSYTITVKDEEQAAAAKELIEEELYEVFGDSNAYTVTSMAELLDTMTSMIGLVIGILAVIAGISLVVGGIGIMNIMLVSVTERTREIGIRKALGAKEGVILRQFVMEAATTSALGGIAGILLGYGLSEVATRVITVVMEEAIHVTPSVVSVAVA